MSQQQRNQNLPPRPSRTSRQQNWTSDNSVQPKLTGNTQPKNPSRNCDPTVPNQQPPTAGSGPSSSNQQPSAAPQHSQSIEVEMAANFKVEVDNQLTSILLANLSKAGGDRNKSLVEDVFRKEINVLKSKIKKGKTEVDNLSEMLKSLEEMEYYTHEKWNTCERILQMLNGEYTGRLDYMKDILSIIQKEDNKRNEHVNEGNHRESLFDKKREQLEQRLDKINSKIDFDIKTRDDMCAQISELNASEARIIPTIEDFRKSNKQLKEEIDKVQVKFEDDDSMASEITKNASEWVNEKRVAVGTLDFIQSEMKKDKKKVSGLLKKEQKANKNMCKEISSLVQECADLKEQMTDLQTSSKLRIATAETEFEQKRSSLYAELRKLSGDMKLLQLEADKKHSQYDEHKRTIEAVSSLRESVNSLEQKIGHLETVKWKLEHKISVIEEYLNDTNDWRNKRHSTSSSEAKRRRLSSSTSVDGHARRLPTSGSSFDLKEVCSEIASHKSTM
ncbi:ERC protein 2-like [Bradysia coprophila]|uniref:ERC protein 2-like n=1 Tax=Bradysia coprophila TaxID=38358 RepID=UPI00187D8610|nr:ERC protein 2-like [Bradysia coprophila]